MTAPSTGAVGDARKRDQETHWDPAVRALIAEAVQAERERIAAAIEWEAGGREAQSLHARDEDVEFFGSKQRLTAEVKALRDAARIARDGGR